MKPYYDHKGITIYHGDCLEIMPQLGEVDLVLTDPPYIGLKGGTDVTFTSGVAGSKSTQKTVGDPWKANLEWFNGAWILAKKGMIVFCSFHAIGILQNKDSIALITWYQRNAMPSMNNVPQYKTEFAWVYKKASGLNWRKLETFYDIQRLQAGCFATERIVDLTGKAIHPSQKPKKLMKNILKIEPNNILDPFMGTGTTLVAAKELNREAIGIEIEEQYCEIAAKRLAQEVFEFK